MAPLIAAVVTAVIQVDRLAQDSRAALIEGEIATQQSRSLVELLIDMQRALTQFQVLKDQDFHETYLERRRVFLNAVENLMELDLTKLAREQLKGLKDDEHDLFERLHGSTSDSEQTPEATTAGLIAAAERENKPEVWADLTNRARSVLSESSRLIETQVDATTERAGDLQRTLLLQAAAVIPATILLAGLFVMMIIRPMREVGYAIRRLGGREFAAPISVHGPRDLEDLGRQLDWLRLRIQDLEHQKMTFLRHISHELKTPLTTIREGSELLAESLVSAAPEEAEISRIICSNSMHLQKLIEDLLQFGKTQELVTDLKILESVDMEAVVHSVVETQALASASKVIRIEQDLAPVRIRGDENKARIVIDNLLNNAIKYTPAGGRVSISLEARDGYAVVSVRDTGPGVAEAEKQKIFEPFQQGQAEYQSSVKGTGLGLAIAREYVEAHDGYIEVVDSTEGAHFRAAFPIAGPLRFAVA
ncbi:MAG TPA: HAMP domain-containing sensor histidine kinase [Gammaproteobacteria bacterium]|nr:HAMP domain-containing sensor histidine kinase [Gammaproteobacteria bacterium]